MATCLRQPVRAVPRRLPTPLLLCLRCKAQRDSAHFCTDQSGVIYNDLVRHGLHERQRPAIRSGSIRSNSVQSGLFTTRSVSFFGGSGVMTVNGGGE